MIGLLSLGKNIIKNNHKLQARINLKLHFEVGNKKDSQWIYSTKHQQNQFRKPGRISIYTHVNQDTHNTSLRLIQHIQRANIILTNSPSKINMYLQSLNKKQRFAYQQQQKTYQNNEKSDKLQINIQNTSLSLIKQQLNKKTLQFDTEIQISKFIQLQKETKKQQKQTNNKYLAKQAKQLKQFMSIKLIQNELKQIKNKQGYPTIFQLTNSISDIIQLQKKGFDLLFLFCEDENNITDCTKIIKLLQNNQLAYQILPCSDKMITAIVSSGLPADRFSVQSYPKQIQALLIRRSNMQITTCIEIQNQKLDELVKAIVKILGKQHIIYLHGENQKYFRGEAIQLQKYLNQKQNYPTTKNVYIVIAPKISQFNEGLKAQLNVKNHIIGQLQSQKINTVQMQILVKKLQQMSKKQEVFQIDLFLMTAELLARLQNDEIVRKCLKKMFPRKKDWQIQKILQQGKKKVIIDHIGINQPLKSNNQSL